MTPMIETLWAMEPVRLEAYLRQLKAGVGAGPAPAPGGGKAESRPYAMTGPVAVIPLSGPLTKNGSWWGTSMLAVADAIRQAAADRSVKAILLDVDSPGGTVSGTEELAGAVRAANQVKPVYAYAADLMCSAAYWVGSQAREIAAQASADIGSIGVLWLHADWSKALEDGGIKLTYLTAGQYKAMGNPAEPLSEESRAYLQEGLDGVYGLFLEAVQDGRRVDRERALAMADGKIFLARQALEIGLIDTVMSREAFINHIMREVHMDLKMLKEQHASVAAEHRAEVEAEAASKRDEAVKAAVAGEQERCLGVASALLGEELGVQLAELVKTGVTAEQAKAFGKFARPAGQGEPQSQGAASPAMLSALAGITQKPVNPAAGPVAEEQDFDALVKAEMAKGASRSDAISKVVKSNPKAHAGWLARHQKQGGE